MTPKQKRIIGILAIANVVVILTMVGLVTHPTGTSAPRVSPSSTPILPLPTCHALPNPTAVWQTTRLLAQAGLGGTVTLTPGGSLRFDIVAPDGIVQTASIPENEGAVDEAAQSVWTAFDVALALQTRVQETEGACTAFTEVQVTILVRGEQADTQIRASVSASDLMAYDAGELSEDAFIERVTYDVNVVRDA
jgi:hypothetical protein